MEEKKWTDKSNHRTQRKQTVFLVSLGELYGFTKKNEELEDIGWEEINLQNTAHALWNIYIFDNCMYICGSEATKRREEKTFCVTVLDIKRTVKTYY